MKLLFSTGVLALVLFGLTAFLLLYAQLTHNLRIGRLAAISSMPTVLAAIYCMFMSYTGENDVFQAFDGPKTAVQKAYSHASGQSGRGSGSNPDRAAGATTGGADPVGYRGQGAVGDEFQDCTQCPLMVVVPSGYGTVGASDGDALAKPEEHPKRAIRIPNRFAIGRYEITAAEFAKFTDATGHAAPKCSIPHQISTDRSPVHCVSPTDAQAYIAWLVKTTGRRYRLPTQTEWEYAARAGSVSRFATGDTITQAAAEVGIEAGQPRPVGAYPANAFGMHGVHGGVAEIVSDCWYPTMAKIPTDGRPPAPPAFCQWYTLKDGGWIESPDRARFSARRPIERDHRDGGIGFRLVRDVTAGSFSP